MPQYNNRPTYYFLKFTKHLLLQVVVYIELLIIQTPKIKNRTFFIHEMKLTPYLEILYDGTDFSPMNPSQD